MPYQSCYPDIVKLQTRVADPTGDGAAARPTISRGRRRTIARRPSSISSTRPRQPGQKVTVDFALHLRHLPPYFLTGLDGRYPDNLTGETLLKQMVVSTAAVAKVTSKRVPQV